MRFHKSTNSVEVYDVSVVNIIHSIFIWKKKNYENIF